MLKKGEVLGKFANLDGGGGLGKKERVVFFRGGVDIPMHTMVLQYCHQELTLKIGTGPRPAFEYNRISQNTCLP